MTLLIETGANRWTRMLRGTGVIGLVSIVLLFAPIIAISSLGEPPFVASAEQALAFFVNGSQGWVQAATALTSLAAIGLIWFVVGLSLLLGRAEGNIGFANVWLAMASLAAACGWLVLSTRVVARWLGWWAIASGLGLVIARFFWTSAIWFLPYAAFWIWVIILCIKLIRRPAAMLSGGDGRNRQVGELP